MRPHMSSREEDESFLAESDPGRLLREFGKRLVRLRERRMWSRGELARELGVPRGRLAKWEYGANEPPLCMLAPLAKTLGVTLEELVTGEPPSRRALTPLDLVQLSRHLEGLQEWIDIWRQ